MEPSERVVLVGFSGAGKSTVARRLAATLGWDLVDTDLEVERAAGTTIPEVFRRSGEAAFRTMERQALARASGGAKVVVACGGGAAVDPEVWDAGLLGAAGTLVVALDARPETALGRLRIQAAREGSAVERPMLEGDDPLGRIERLKRERQDSYDRADVTLVVDGLSADAVAAEVAALVDRAPGTAGPEVVVATGGAQSEIHVRRGVSGEVGGLARARWPRASRAWIISDEHVATLHGDTIQEALRRDDFEAPLVTVPPGEGSKSLTEAGRLWDALLGGGIERGDLVVALGGGVVGDLAGFVAATTLRGVGLMQVPTSLLAMVDSSVGGKTGIDHRAGKNLIGVFVQPPVVAIDPGFLATLPPREVRNGWAEIVKHAIIQPSTPGGARADLETVLARNRRALLALAEPAMSYLVRRNVALKAAVVEADERESGVRAFLNFGHTLGHAIEAAGYRLPHGEAVAVGMRAVARIGARIGACGEADVARIDAAVDRFGLPRGAEVDPERVLALLGSDKKRVRGRQRWVVPIAGGGVALRDDVPPAAVRAALASVVLPGEGDAGDG